MFHFRKTMMAFAIPFFTALPLAAFAQTADLPDFPTADFPPPGDAFPTAETQFPSGVTATSDIIYKVENGFRPLTLDIYRQKDASKARPVVLYIHGGGWQASHKRAASVFTDFPGILADLATKGYVTASAEYRLSGEAPFPAAEYDVKAAIRFLRENADEYGIDPDRIAVWGSSAGGHLAALAAVTCDSGSLAKFGDERSEVSDCVQAAAIWYGIFDMHFGAEPPKASLDRTVPFRFLGCDPGACPEYLIEAASPISNLDANDPPFLLAHGEEDSIVPIAQSKAMEAKLKEAGIPVETHYVAGANHSFVSGESEKTRKAALEALVRTYQFFDDKLLAQQ